MERIHDKKDPESFQNIIMYDLDCEMKAFPTFNNKLTIILYAVEEQRIAVV